MTTHHAADVPTPQWSDLWCRRIALGLTQARLAEHLGMAQTNLAAAENARRPVPKAIWPQIEKLESVVAQIVDQLYGEAISSGAAATATVWLDTYQTDEQFTHSHRRYSGMPVELHRIAAGRAAAALTATGRTVRIRIPDTN